MPELASSLVRLEESGGPRAVSCQLCAATDRQAVPGPRCRGPQYTEYVSTRSYTRATGARTTVRPVDAARADLSAHRQQGHPIDGTRPGRGQPHPHGRDGMHGRGRMPFSFLHQQAIASPKPRWPTDLPPTEEQQRRQPTRHMHVRRRAAPMFSCSVQFPRPSLLRSSLPFLCKEEQRAGGAKHHPWLSEPREWTPVHAHTRVLEDGGWPAGRRRLALSLSHPEGRGR
jgi:hypothetical protein